MARNLRVGIQRGLRQSIGGGFGTGDIFTLSPASFDFSRTNTKDSRITFTRASSATFVGADGLIKTASTNEARFDHNPSTGESLGLLLEKAQTNFALNSDSVQGSSIGTAIPNSTESVVSPRGITETVRRLGRDVPAGGAQTWRVGSTSGGTPNTTYTISFYAKTVSGGTTSINVDINDTTPTGGQATTITGEWTRITKTGGSANNNLRFFDMNMVTATADFYVWGAQIELGSFASSYIPTTSSQVTRAADIAEITGTNFSNFFNQSEGTIFLENAQTATPFVPFAYDFSDGTTNNSHRLLYISTIDPTPIKVRTNTSNSNVVDFSYTAPPVGQSQALAYAYKDNDFALSVNGASVVSDTTGTVPTVINKLTLGNAFSGVNAFSGYIKRLSYFSTRQPNTILQSITS